MLYPLVVSNARQGSSPRAVVKRKIKLIVIERPGTSVPRGRRS
jgi:hypothetical protein